VKPVVRTDSELCQTGRASPERCRTRPILTHACLPQQFLYFFPLPHGQGSLRPTFGASLRVVGITSSSSSPFLLTCSSRANPRCSRRGNGPAGVRDGCPVSAR